MEQRDFIQIKNETPLHKFTKQLLCNLNIDIPKIPPLTFYNTSSWLVSSPNVNLEFGTLKKETNKGDFANKFRDIRDNLYKYAIYYIDASKAPEVYQTAIVHEHDTRVQRLPNSIPIVQAEKQLTNGFTTNKK